MAIRIGVVQQGDHPDAAGRLAAGEPEWYAGVRHSVEAVEALVAGVPHLIVSLNAPSGAWQVADARYAGIGEPGLPSFLPGRIRFELWARRVVAELRRFAPTHVLLRGSGILGLRVARFCVDRKISTLAVLASGVDDPNPRNQRVNRRYMKLLNSDCVYRVGNYKEAATHSMVEYGLHPEKAVAWEFPAARHARDHAPKLRRADEPCHVVFAGNLLPEKGARDVLDAVARLHGSGRKIHLTILGDGPQLPELEQAARALPDRVVDLPGRVSNDRMFELLRACTVVCVPSHHSFPEGLPMSLTESLASRSPTVISDHPVFVRTFADGEGVRIVTARDPAAMASAIAELCDDPEWYRRLSESTLDAYERTRCDRTFDGLLREWKASFAAEGRCTG